MQIDYAYCITLYLFLILNNIFPVTVRLFRNRSQMTLKSAKEKKTGTAAASRVSNRILKFSGNFWEGELRSRILADSEKVGVAESWPKK